MCELVRLELAPGFTFIAPETIHAFTGRDPRDPEMVERYANLVDDLLMKAAMVENGHSTTENTEEHRAS